MNLNDVTPLILTFNEAPNLRRALDKLQWAKCVIVIDSNSTDSTLEIAHSFPNVRVLCRAFDDHTTQWNYGLSQIQTDWVLTLDADYLVADSLCEEIVSIENEPKVYYAKFWYCVFGHRLRASLYPPRAVLFQPKLASYRKDGHTQLLHHDSVKPAFLMSRILHDDRKPLWRWLRSQVSYADLEADKLNSSKSMELGWKDSIRKQLFFAPVLVLMYCLFFKGLIFDGVFGLYYCIQRVLAESILSLTLMEKMFSRESAEQINSNQTT